MQNVLFCGPVTNQFKDKVAIVVGGASGIGRALCCELCRHGALVTVCDIDFEAAQNVAQILRSSGGQAEALFMNVTQMDSVQECVDKIVVKYGVLDYFFNSTGIAIVGEMFDMAAEHWQRLIDVNLWGVIYGTTTAYSIMHKQGHGQIVNVASMAGLIPGPTAAAYATTKHAIVGLSLSLRVEAADLGVRVNVVCPGSINTGIIKRTTVLRGTYEDVFPRRPRDQMLASACAQSILHGVQRNRAIITIPFWSSKLLWWLYRISPRLVEILAIYRIRYYRHRYAKLSDDVVS